MLSGVLKGFCFFIRNQRRLQVGNKRGNSSNQAVSHLLSLLFEWMQPDIHSVPTPRDFYFLVTAVLGPGEETGGNASKLRGWN